MEPRSPRRPRRRRYVAGSDSAAFWMGRYLPLGVWEDYNGVKPRPSAGPETLDLFEDSDHEATSHQQP